METSHPDLIDGLAGGLAYGAVGLVLMAIGYLLVDLATPGKLRDLIWEHRNGNAALLLVSGLLGVGIILTTAIVASEGDLLDGLIYTASYGLLGLVLMSVSFLIIDFITPSKLSEVFSDEKLHPGAWVSATAHVAISVIIAAAIY
ncbi:MAG: DUF350 domain-containing protein [Pseudonocardiaceae bacterium]|nr:DUF350 domain-containing protein [Pseudonocardiaceae bacterium]